MRYNLECFHCRICATITFVQLKPSISVFPTEDAYKSYKAKEDHAKPLVLPGRVRGLKQRQNKTAQHMPTMEALGVYLRTETWNKQFGKGIWKITKKYKNKSISARSELYGTLLRGCRSFDVLLYRLPLTSAGNPAALLYIVHAVDQNLEWPGMAP